MDDRVTIILDKEVSDKIFEIKKDMFVSSRDDISRSKIINTLLCIAFHGAENLDSEQWSKLREYAKKKYHKKERKKKHVLQDISSQIIIDELSKKT